MIIWSLMSLIMIYRGWGGVHKNTVHYIFGKHASVKGEHETLTFSENSWILLMCSGITGSGK